MYLGARERELVVPGRIGGPNGGPRRGVLVGSESM